MPTDGQLLLLDTHIWIWYANAVEDETSPSLHDRLQQAGTEGRLLISTISVWEVGVLSARGRLRFVPDVDQWARRALRLPGLRTVDLTASVALASTLLPGNLHHDPADRFLVATARSLDATLVTRDWRIRKYAEPGHLAVLDATP